MKDELTYNAELFLKGFLGGVVVSIGAVMYLFLKLTLILPIGYLIAFYLGGEIYLESIYNHRINGRILNNLLSNTMGAILSGALCRYAFPELISKATEICLEKNSYGVRIIPFAVFTGLAFATVLECFKRRKNIFAILTATAMFYVGGEDFVLNVLFYSIAGVRANGNIILLLFVSGLILSVASKPNGKVITENEKNC